MTIAIQKSNQILQFQSDMPTASPLLTSLAQRIQTLEQGLAVEKRTKDEATGQHLNQLFVERQQKERLSLQLKEAKDQIQAVSNLLNQKIERVAELERKQTEDREQMTLLQQQIQASRVEVLALTNQVVLEREQLRLLVQQLEIANVRGNALGDQVNQMARLIEKQQALIERQEEGMIQKFSKMTGVDQRKVELFVSSFFDPSKIVFSMYFD